jgi:hypothetical protein
MKIVKIYGLQKEGQWVHSRTKPISEDDKRIFGERDRRDIALKEKLRKEKEEKKLDELGEQIKELLEKQLGISLTEDEVLGIQYSKTRLLDVLNDPNRLVEFKWDLDGSWSTVYKERLGKITGYWRIKEVLDEISIEDKKHVVETTVTDTVAIDIPVVHHQCEICDRIFSTKRGLTTHKRVHK